MHAYWHAYVLVKHACLLILVNKKFLSDNTVTYIILHLLPTYREFVHFSYQNIAGFSIFGKFLHKVMVGLKKSNSTYIFICFTHELCFIFRIPLRLDLGYYRHFQHQGNFHGMKMLVQTDL